MSPTELAATNGMLGVIAVIQLFTSVMFQRILGPAGLIAANALCTCARAVAACDNVAAVIPKRPVLVASSEVFAPLPAHLLLGTLAFVGVLVVTMVSERKLHGNHKTFWGN